MSRGKDKAAGVVEYFETVSLDKAEVVLAFAKRVVKQRQDSRGDFDPVKKPAAKRGRKPRKVTTPVQGIGDGVL